MKFTSVFLTVSLALAIPQYSFGVENKKENSTYRLAISKPIENFDPINSDNPTNANIIRNLYSTLVTYRTQKDHIGQNYGDIVPYLAEEWNVTSNRKIYNFKIKDNAYFSNGRKCNAFDIKHTIERLANPKVLPASYEWLFKDLPIRGLQKYQRDCRNNVKEPDLSGIKVLDENLVQIEFDRPSPLFLKELAMPIFSIIPKEEVDKWGSEYGYHPVGTGAYSLEKSTPEQIILTKNTGYFEKGLPHINTLVYKVIPKAEDEYSIFQKGRLEQTEIPDGQIDQLFQKENWNKYSINVFDNPSFNDRKVSDVIKEPKMVSTFLGISTKNVMFKSQKARQALNYAVNKQMLITSTLKYKAIESNGILPEDFPGVNWSRKAPYPYDLVKAKKFLYESGFTDYNNDGILEYKKKPVTLNFWYYDDPETEKVCQAVSENLQAAGFKVNLNKSKKWKTFLQKVISGQADLYHFSWKAKYDDPDKFLTPLFDSKYIGSSNISGFKDKNIDNMLSKARKIPEDEFRNRIYKNIENTIVEKAPWVFLYQPVKYVRVRPYVYGMQLHPVMEDIIKYTYFKTPEPDNIPLSKPE